MTAEDWVSLKIGFVVGVTIIFILLIILTVWDVAKAQRDQPASPSGSTSTVTVPVPDERAWR